MRETKFTPGPWEKMHDHPDPETRRSLANIRGPVDKYGMRDEVASVYLCDYGSRRRDYDAHLIAAAPELYEALENWLEAENLAYPSVLERDDAINAAEKKALAALAKARGEA